MTPKATASVTKSASAQDAPFLYSTLADMES
jgi:hypothetical protein